MAAIYNNAYLVVGASCAADNSGAFIASPKYKPSVHVAIVEKADGSVSNVHARIKQEHGRLCSPFARQTGRGPLSSRGWTLQAQISYSLVGWYISSSTR